LTKSAARRRRGRCPTTEPQWWNCDLFRPFESSRRDLQWFELLERIREIACDCGVARRHDGKIYTYYRRKDAEVYSVTFKQFMGAQWGEYERWKARDIFDAVNVVLSEADYNNCTLPDDCDWPPPGGGGGGKDRVVQLRRTALMSTPPAESAPPAKEGSVARSPRSVKCASSRHIGHCHDHRHQCDRTSHRGRDALERRSLHAV
jgi:hypothetical protein